MTSVTLFDFIRVAFAVLAGGTLTVSAFRRIIKAQGRASAAYGIALVCVLVGSALVLLGELFGAPEFWHYTLSITGGALLVVVREHEHVAVDRQNSRAFIYLGVASVLVFSAINYSKNLQFGPSPSYRVDSIQIADGVVGQVKYEFTVRGQRIRPCGSDYDYTIYDVDLKKTRKSGTLKGRQAQVSPTATIKFDQPIGPFEKPGLLEYRFSPVDRCGSTVYEHPQSKLTARFRVRG